VYEQDWLDNEVENLPALKVGLVNAAKCFVFRLCRVTFHWADPG